MNNLTLEPQTLNLLVEAFQDKKCNRCGANAQRLAQGEFLCHHCAQPTNSISPISDMQEISMSYLIGR